MLTLGLAPLGIKHIHILIALHVVLYHLGVSALESTKLSKALIIIKVLGHHLLHELHLLHALVSYYAYVNPVVVVYLYSRVKTLRSLLSFFIFEGQQSDALGFGVREISFCLKAFDDYKIFIVEASRLLFSDNSSDVFLYLTLDYHNLYRDKAC